MFAEFIEIFQRALVCVAAVIALTRLSGLRSFAKMTSFDFAITVACGSVIASSVISTDESVLLGVAALGSLFLVQAIVGHGRRKYAIFQKTIENAPVLIMKDGEVLHQNLKRAQITEADLFGKLREANAFDLRRVHAVVFEPTGDISVLHGTSDSSEKVSSRILEGVET